MRAHQAAFLHVKRLLAAREFHPSSARQTFRMAVLHVNDGMGWRISGSLGIAGSLLAGGIDARNG